jgi:hypothetical protein
LFAILAKTNKLLFKTNRDNWGESRSLDQGDENGQIFFDTAIVLSLSCQDENNGK